MSRWQAIAEAAAKQSGRGIIPEVHEVVDFGKALEMAGELEKNVIPYELFDDMEATKQVLENITEAAKIIKSKYILKKLFPKNEFSDFGFFISFHELIASLLVSRRVLDNLDIFLEFGSLFIMNYPCSK